MSIIDNSDIEINPFDYSANLTEFDYVLDPDVEQANKDYRCAKDSKPISTRTAKEIAADLERKAANQKAKTTSIKHRRREFAKSQAQAILELLDSGVDYVCCVDGCEETEFLTIDHKLAVSRGGSDELDNLQFMCKSHNSSKSDR